MQKAAFALLFCLAATIQTSVGMRCYSCSSRSNRGCADPFIGNSTDHSLTGDCTIELAKGVIRVIGDSLRNSANIKARSEMKQLCIKFKSNEDVHRECGAGTEEEWCASLKSKYAIDGGFADCSACTDELCNSGHALHAFSGFVLASFALIMGRYM